MQVKLILTSLFLFLFFLSCEDQSSIQQESSANSNLSLNKTSNNSYLIISNSNKLSSKLDKDVAAANGTITNKLDKIGIAVAYSEDAEFVSNASKINGVKSVVPNLNIQWTNPVENQEGPTTDAANPPTSGDDDYFFDLQWGHDAVDAPEAWEAGYRGAGVRVAVLDGGFDLDHPDLAPNINLALSADMTGEGLQYGLPDPFSHGTHVAGTIAAADNAFGTIGVAPEAELVLVKVLFDVGSGTFEDVIEGIIYAADVEADVINMSLSANFPKSLGQEAAELKNAINRATNYAYQKGTTVIAAAANDGYDRDHTADITVVPADGSNVIAISATSPYGWGANPNTNLDVFASLYSNYGQSAIDFAAPGGNYAYAFDPNGFDPATVAGLTTNAYVFDYVFSTGNGGWYWSVGTSMAAPHAAGVAALIIGKHGGSLHPAKVKTIMKQSADDLGKPGNDDFYGQGRVNAYNAVK